MFSRISKQTVTSLLIVSFLLPSAAFFAPKPAEAAGGGCAAVVAAAIATVVGVSAASKITGVPTADFGTQAGAASVTGSSYGQFFKDCILIPIATRMAKEMLRKMTTSIVDWINSGFQGNPSFVQDLNGLITDTADQVVGDYIQTKLGGGFLCSSFSLQVRVALAQSYLPYRQRSACTLTQITNNVNGIFSGANAGGWNNWIQMSANPQNNAYGATILAQDEISKAVAEKLGIQGKTLDWGAGFRSWKECATDAQVKEKLDQEAGYSPDIMTYDKGTLDANRDCKDQTPGKVAQELLVQSLGSGIRELEIANDIDAIVGALTNQLMAQVITGAKGLLGAGKNSNGSYQSSNYQTALNNEITDASISSAIDSGINQGIQSSGFDAIFSTTVGTGTPTVAPTPDTNPDEDGFTAPVTQNIDWSLERMSPTVNATTPFEYNLELRSDYSARNLSIATTLRRGNTAVPFTSIFSSPRVMYGRTDGSIASAQITSATDSSVTWTRVATDKNVRFIIQFSGSKKSGATAGNYTIETSVSDDAGNVLKVETDSFVVQ
jgi:hypothetical protein